MRRGKRYVAIERKRPRQEKRGHRERERDASEVRPSSERKAIEEWPYRDTEGQKMRGHREREKGKRGEARDL